MKARVVVPVVLLSAALVAAVVHANRVGHASLAVSTPTRATAAHSSAGSRGDSPTTNVRLEGVVVDPDGGPAVGATVCRSAAGSVLCASVDATGSFRFDVAPDEMMRLDATSPVHAPGAWFDGTGEAWFRPHVSRRDLIIRLMRGGVVVRGKVVDVGGGPIVGADVRVGAARRGAISTTDAEGAFSVVVASGLAFATATHDGYASVTDKGTVPGTFFTLRMSPGATLGGVVVNAKTSEPVSGARVSVEPRTGAAAFSRVGEVSTDSDGHFRFTGVPSGRYWVDAEAPGLLGRAEVEAVLEVGERRDDVRVDVHPAAHVSVRVLLDDDAPCEGASVLLERALDRRRWGHTDGAGGARIEAVLPGTYDVEVKCPTGFLAGRLPALVVPPSGIDDVVLRVVRGRAIRGRVVDEKGQGVVGEIVSRRRNGNPDVDRSPAKTADDGQFIISGLAPANYELEAFRVNAKGAVVVGAARDVDDVLLVAPGHAIVGRVEDSTHRTRGGIEVSARSRKGRGQAATLDDGSFEIRHLPGGSYDVTAQGAQAHVEVGPSNPSVTLIVAPAETVSGVVVDETGAPVADVQVRVDPPGELRDFLRGQALFTTADGRFESPPLTPGEYDVRATTPTGMSSFARATKTGSPVVLTLLRPGSVAGRVTSRGRPVERFSVTVKRPDDRQDVTSSFAAGGSYRIDALAPGAHHVEIVAPEGRAEADVTVTSSSLRDGLDFELAPAAVVRGRVEDFESRAPLVAVWVSVGDRSAWTDEAGRFELHDARPGSATVHLSEPPGYCRFSRDLRLTPGGEVETLIRLPMRREGSRMSHFFTQSRSDGAVDVDWVVPEGSADTQGLVAGDVVDSVDGVSLVDLGNKEAFECLSPIPAGGRRRFGLRRGAVIEISGEK